MEDDVPLAQFLARKHLSRIISTKNDRLNAVKHSTNYNTLLFTGTMLSDTLNTPFKITFDVTRSFRPWQIKNSSRFKVLCIVHAGHSSNSFARFGLGTGGWLVFSTGSMPWMGTGCLARPSTATEVPDGWAGQ